MHKLQDSDFIIGFTVGNRQYELVPFLKSGELAISVEKMLRRAELLEAKLGEEDARWILNHQSEIRPLFRGRFSLIFAAWFSGGVNMCLDWDPGDERWTEEYIDYEMYLGHDIKGEYYGWRLVRRVK